MKDRTIKSLVKCVEFYIEKVNELEQENKELKGEIKCLTKWYLSAVSPKTRN